MLNLRDKEKIKLSLSEESEWMQYFKEEKEKIQKLKNEMVQIDNQAVRSVEFYRVQMYWKLGERIFNEEQLGKERADYGTYLIRNLAKEIEPEFGSGFSYRQLERFMAVSFV